jgi:hypothetical protein
MCSHYDPIEAGSAEHIEAVIDGKSEELRRRATRTDPDTVTLPRMYELIEITGRQEVG